jgi:hypothetical protein
MNRGTDELANEQHSSTGIRKYELAGDQNSWCPLPSCHLTTHFERINAP